MKGPNERLLRAVPCLLAIAQHLVGQAPHPLTVLLDQRLERRGVSGDAPLDEGALVGSGSRLRSPVRTGSLDGVSDGVTAGSGRALAPPSPIAG